MRFFNLDLHISVIADVKDILERYGHEVVSWNISGHNFVFGRDRDPVKIVNEHTWQSMDQEMCDRFYEEYKDYLNQFDGFIVTYSSAFALLYEKFNKPIIMVNPMRYETPFSTSPEKWEWLNEYLTKGVRNNKIFLVSNNKGDSYYLEYYTGIKSEVIPSLCVYTKLKYRGLHDYFYTHAEWVGDNLNKECNDWEQMKQRSGLLKRLPIPYEWRDLYDAKGIVHIPYIQSFMSLFEQYSANVPLFFPSKEFLFKLNREHPSVVLSIISPFGAASRCTRLDEPNNVSNPDVIRRWIDLADFYDQEDMPHIQYYNSFDELEYLLRTADVSSISRKMQEHNKIREQKILKQWQQLLEKVSRSCS